MEDQKQPQAPWWQPGLILFFKLSGWIVIPILFALAVGKWLDRHFGTAPILFVVTVGASFLVSTIGLVYESSRAMRKIEEEERLKSKDKSGKEN